MNTARFRLARADGVDQQAIVGGQAAGRVGFFLRVDDFEATHRRLAAELRHHLTEQLVRLITSQRLFQANAQVISTLDTLAQTIINIR